MKKICSIFILTFFYLQSGYSQPEFKLTIAASQTLSMPGIIITTFNYANENAYLGSAMAVGSTMLTSKGNLTLGFAYQYSRPISSKATSHLGGLYLNYRVLNESKVASPIFQAMIFTEMASNYDNSLIVNYRLTNSINMDYMPHVYRSTPIVFSITSGYDFRLFEGFHLSLLLGFGFRRIHSDRILKDYEGIEYVKEVHNFYYLNPQFELSYSIPFKKKIK